jgi:hypothetical protein
MLVFICMEFPPEGGSIYAARLSVSYSLRGFCFSA